MFGSSDLLPGERRRDSSTEDFRWKLAESEPEGLFSLDSFVDRHVGTGAYRGLEFLHVNARSVINEIPKQSRMPFRYTINVYRGCSHACVYCFARPTHSYLNLNIGEDFERKIVVKVNTVERLRNELRSSRWGRDPIAMGTNTDPYQRAEGKYHLTRGVIGELAAAANPFSILTKSTLILRDFDLLVEAAQRADVRISVSIGTLDREVWKRTEPGTPPPDKRLDVVRRFAQAGVGCGVLIAPILPGLSDSDEQIAQVATACLEAGASSISAVPLHLRPGVREHYLAWLARELPALVPLYAKRFARGGYQDGREQQRIATIVSEVLGKSMPRGYLEDRRRENRFETEVLSGEQLRFS